MALSILPNPLSPDTTKDSPAFGLKFMKGIHDKESLNSRETYAQRKARYEYNRLFASGKQPMEEYMDILDVNGDESVIQLITEPLPIAIPFLNRMYDRYLQREEKIECNAIDPFTQSKKEKAKQVALFNLKQKETIQALQQEAGTPLVEYKEDDPETESELLMEYGFNYKEREEIMMEQGIDIVFYENNFNPIIKKRILKDLAECGIAQIVPYINANGRIKIDFTKPENILSSYSEWDDFRDCQYQGRYFMMSIYDIRILYPEVVAQMGGEQKLYELSQSNPVLTANNNQRIDWNYGFNDAIARPYDNFKVQVLEVSLKTLYKLKKEVNRDRFGKEVLDPAIKKRTRNQEYIESNPYEVEYKGLWIVDTQWLLRWGLAKNMIKPSQNLTEVQLPFITYMYDNNKMSNKPLIEMMIPSIKKMQLIDLQQQKIIAAVAPDGYDVDISTASDIDIGNGQGELNPFQLYKVYKQTGIRYYKRLDDSGEANRTVPITPNNFPFSPKLEQLMLQWNAEYDKLNKYIGDNNLAAGVITNQATGKSVLQDAKQIAESASNYIYLGYLNIMERTARTVMYMLWDMLVYGKKQGIPYFDGYRKALGTERVEYIKLEADDDFEKTQFDVKIQAVVSDAEIQAFEQNIQAVLGVDPTMLPDVTQARRLAKTNMKYAVAFLMARYQKRLKDKSKEVAQNNEEMRNAAIAGAQAKSQGEIQLETVKAQLKAESQKQELEFQRELEAIKYFGIAKAKIIDKLLSRPDADLSSLPAFLIEGMDVVTKTQTEMLQEVQDQQEQEYQAEMEAQAQAEQQAQMQQQNPQQQMGEQEQPMDEQNQMAQ